jgi:hypothetical protein
MTNLPRPIPESYWVIPGQFLAGGYPALRADEIGTHRRLIALLSAGFNSFIDLTCAGERPPYLPALQAEAKKVEFQILHRRFSFPDFGVPGPEMMTATLDAIDAAVVQGCKVYLHCVGGIGRTGTTVGCYFIRHGMEPAQALNHLRELYQTAAQSCLFPLSPESEQQVRFILTWKEHGLA